MLPVPSPADHPLVVRLPYSIFSASSYSARYVPENIQINAPEDQSSRWSGAHAGSQVKHKQWIIVKLDRVSVVKSITFGKHHKPHPCNLKEFKVYGGLNPDQMSELLHSGLRNDTTAQTFHLRHQNNDGVFFPCQYLKIVPISAHGQGYNTSIWFVSFAGIEDSTFVQKVCQDYTEYRERTAIRLILKHLRQREYTAPYHTLLSQFNHPIEHPLVTSLHHSLVHSGDFTNAESLLTSASTLGLFDRFISSSHPHPIWTRLYDTSLDGDTPSRRGGHQMCIDPDNGIIYLLGGWDGRRNLADFWKYDVRERKWHAISMDTAANGEGGPGKRSCHKMIFDNATGYIYVLGRYKDAEVPGSGSGPSGPSAAPTTPGPSGDVSVDPNPMDASLPLHPASSAAPPPPEPSSASTDLANDFYRYATRGPDEGKWELLSSDTAADGGPPLIFDLQMAIDSERQTLYVFGGRIVDPDPPAPNPNPTANSGGAGANMQPAGANGHPVHPGTGTGGPVPKRGEPTGPPRYSGLYSYHVPTRKWTLIFKDPDPTSPNPPAHPYIPSRIGHSMIYVPQSQLLYVFAGQRDDNFLSDMYTYSTSGTHEIAEISSDYTTDGRGPEAGFTQRATMDEDMREFYILSGLMLDRNSKVEAVRSSFWIFRLDKYQWIRVQDQDSEMDHQTNSNMHGAPAGSASTSAPMSAAAAATMLDPARFEEKEPRPRYAHQMVYDPIRKYFFMFGGNLGTPDGARLDDFWRLELVRPSTEDILRKAKLKLRCQKFLEMCTDADPMQALTYLQTDLSALVNHQDEEESASFRSLLSHLLTQSMARPPQPPVALPAASATPTASSSYGGVASSGALEQDIQMDEDDDEDDTDDEGDSASASTSKPESGSGSLLSQAQLAAKEMERERYRRRTEIFEEILRFFDPSSKQPQTDLLDLVHVEPDDM